MALAALLANPVCAQEAGREPQGDHGDAHARATAPDEIVVTGHPPVDFGILASSVSIEGDALVAETRGQIGDTLASLPGISSTSFAPGASRPILRGLGGDRVAVLLDGIGSIDASNVSVDHAVVFDPLTVDHIDVFHGPAVLLFGGNAIGGAVNALDKRIPRRVPDHIHATGIIGYGSAADERSASGAIEVPLAANLAFHADASWRKSDDLRVGGYVNSRPLRQELVAEAAELLGEGEAGEAEEYEELANLKNHLPNSGARTLIAGAGVAWVGDRGDLGVSYQRYDTRYGVPLRPGAGHHHGPETASDPATEDSHEGEAETVSIDLVQDRFDLRGALRFDGFLDSLQLRAAYGEYEHIEFEGEERGTTFAADGFEMRIDAIQAERGGWRGRSGVQYVDRSLAVDGAEAFVPDYSVERFGIFTLQSLEALPQLTVDIAGRYESTRITSGEAGFARSFDLWSGAGGLVYEPAAGLKLGLNYTHGARAPSPEALLSEGLHVATQAFETGNRTFGIEKSDSFEAYVRYTRDNASLSLTGYRTSFDGFITAVPTDLEAEGFPVFRYVQVPARFTGFEASASVEPLSWSVGEVKLDASADYTRARLSGIGPAPRIPPLRLQAGAEVRHKALRLHAEIEWNDRQKRVASFENAVPGFTFVNLSADWHPLGEDGPVTLILDARNIFDVDARRAASFTRDFVPLPGRDIRLTAKVSF
ncbi:MAG: TonB-dependent receptor [Sphingomonadaceae bacterium]